MNPLAVQLNRLQLDNPILVASGTFGYAKEMQAYVDFSKLGGIVPKTITPQPRAGNNPPRTIETASGLLNSIGLDNDGIDYFIANHLDYLASLGTKVIVNIAGKDEAEYQQMAARLAGCDGVAGLELNVSCPNVSHGVDYGSDPEKTQEVVSAVRSVCDYPITAKPTPNVTNIVPIAQAAADGGADAVTLINTLKGIAIDWQKRRPILGAITGGLSGPAIKPVALRVVWEVASNVDVPIIGVGGIESITDVLEFLVAGASAVQIGTANFYNPGLSSRLVGELADTLERERLDSVTQLVGSLKTD